MKKMISVKTSFVPDGKTKYCFLFGDSIENSLSPAMHTEWFLREKLNCVYLSMPVKSEDVFLSLVKDLIDTDSFIGGNITLPFKNTILKSNLFELSKRVETIHAANTIYRNDKGKWCLDNTDIFGVQDSIQHLVKTGEKYIALVLGGGGAAASAIYNCIEDKNCLKIVCSTRSPEKTKEHFPFLSNERKVAVNSLEFEKLFKCLSFDCDDKIKVLIINTIPIGQNSLDVNPFAISAMEHTLKITQNKNIFYFDLIYIDSKAILYAKDNKIKAINGKRMLISQAKKSFALWTGIEVKS
ncbi:shikimate dehydrogenase family protein [Fluviispira multicolorata]|uniref:Shikimate dehydrogenase substrate binding N-terminal domain-containing protein n=1 Tax=Fluviispira multicolorata TaxID=2654512 RepID=A0A833JCD6_9BACT|nr:hypothetical protein [Fluviispira multicolorata]KAB8030751.1 hypothetical protein GCL57_07195 [Fluviispira multicolorata]